MSKELTYAEVKEHTTKKDLYMVVSDKVYNASNFVDEHPGGEEVLLDVAGQDATEAFEDVGHSDEAREILEGLLVGNLKRSPDDPKPHNVHQKTASSGAPEGGMGAGLYAVIAMGMLLAVAAYYVMQNPDSKK